MSDVMKSVLGCRTFQMNDTVCTYRDSHVTADIASGKCLPINQCRNGCASPQQTCCSKKKSSSLCDAGSVMEVTDPMMPLQPLVLMGSFTTWIYNALMMRLMRI